TKDMRHELRGRSQDAVIFRGIVQHTPGFGHFSVMTERVLCTPLMQSVVKRNFLFKQAAYLIAESFDVVQLVVADPFLQCEQLALDLVIVTFLPRTEIGRASCREGRSFSVG